MTIEEKAEAYAKKYINHKMAVHDIYEAEVVQKDVTRLLVDFVTEATKELQEKLEESERRVSNYRTWVDKIKALKCVKIGKCAGELQELKEENTELKEKLKPENCLKLLAKGGYVKFTSDKLTEAKDLIRNLLRVTYGEGWNYDLGWKVKAEAFLKEVSE